MIARITAALPLNRVGTSTWQELSALIGYDPGIDPVAVTIVFPSPAGPVTWLMARDLLRAGLDAPAGDGDVRVWPSLHAPGALFLHVRTPAGEALFEAPRGVVAAFLARTDRVVPPGTEGEHLDLDGELEQLGGEW